MPMFVSTKKHPTLLHSIAVTIDGQRRDVKNDINDEFSYILLSFVVRLTPPKN